MRWGDLHQIFLNTAREYGADVRFECSVTRYFETEESAGVEVDGKEYIADVVIGADGMPPFSESVSEVVFVHTADSLRG